MSPEDLQALIQGRKYQTRMVEARPRAPKDLNTALVKAALITRKVDIELLTDENLLAFLKFLKKYDLKDILVIGGSVRDLMFNKVVIDLDISVKVALSEDEKVLFRQDLNPGNDRILE